MHAYSVKETSKDRSTAAHKLDHAPDITRVQTGFVNTYLVGTRERWILVDTGIAGFAPLIKRAAAARFGPESRPSAIVLTHGHFDHAGNADALARHWNVAVYAHPLEQPYLTGESDYPPQDPTVGGAIAVMSRTFPHRGRALQSELRMLTGESVDLPGWRWIHTPGHTPGHISLFRDADRTLIAGDALATMDMDSWVEHVRRTPEVCNPPAPLTTDWDAARRSVGALAALRPHAIAAGHGLPLAGDDVTEALTRFAASFAPPAHGRYVVAPAQTGPAGVEWLPPAIPDPFPRRAAGAALVVIGAIGLAAASRRRAGRQAPSTT